VRVRLASLAVEVWASVATASAGDGYGVQLLPKREAVVVVAFVSPELPIVLGALWTGAAQPDDEQAPVEDRFSIVTPAGTRITCDDASQPTVTIETPAGNVFVRSAPGDDPTILLLHGYPSSSFDYQQVVPHLAERAWLTLDFLGFGLSDKPRPHRYSLLGQADIVQTVIASEQPGQSCSSRTTWARRSPPSCWPETFRAACHSNFSGWC